MTTILIAFAVVQVVSIGIVLALIALEVRAPDERRQGRRRWSGGLPSALGSVWPARPR